MKDGGSQDEEKENVLIEEEKRLLEVKDGCLQNTTPDGAPVVFASNRIDTSKYTLYDFLPLNMFEQLSRPANFYFVLVGVLQMWKTVSISQGKPTILMPLLFVLIVSMCKDAFEDWKRHIADRTENDRKYLVYDRNSRAWKEVMCTEVKVGDFVRIREDELFPADLLFIRSGDSDPGYCYVETASLDGETSLKIKIAPEHTRGIADGKDIDCLTMSMECAAPNGQLDKFSGMLVMRGERKEQVLSGTDVFLHRGARLKNTKDIIGFVLYTGEETKMQMNSTDNANKALKRSSVEGMMNRQIIFMFSLQVSLCLIAGFGAAAWQGAHTDSGYYLSFDTAPVVTGFYRFFTWFIIFAGFVPISLLVSMEVVKFWQGIFMGWDVELAWYQAEAQELQFAAAQTSSLNEELGQIKYILSDKTGTLTCNSMDFRKCVVGNRAFGKGDTDISRAAKRRGSYIEAKDRDRLSLIDRPVDENSTTGTEDVDGRGFDSLVELAPHVNFDERRALLWPIREGNVPMTPFPKPNEKAPLTQADYTHSFLTALAVCNSVFPAKNADGVIELKSSSPDEDALVQFAKFNGYELIMRDPPLVTVRVTLADGVSTRDDVYEELAILDFTSKRKRMSIVLRDKQDGSIGVFSKGADSSLGPLLRGASSGKLGGTHEDNVLGVVQKNWTFTLNKLNYYGEEGLRTLLVCEGRKPASWWDEQWKSVYATGMKECAVEGPAEDGHFKGSCKNECRRCLLELKLEKAASMNLVGATAIEDKLQDGVPVCIKALLDAGMSVWVLTGDKLETAINIGMACNLLESSMERKGNLLRIQGTTQSSVARELQLRLSRVNQRRMEKSTEPLGLVVTSSAMFVILDPNLPDLLSMFLEIAQACKSVVACRMQPNQKAAVVKLVRTELNMITLAIGDGANDEQMIREANVGVGIRGVEGTSAVRAADYAISQFAFLQKLLLVHGRLCYRRICLLILYIFYKNSVACLVFMWYGLVSGFSGQPLYLEWAYQLYNILFTCYPVMVFALLDRDIDMKILMEVPNIYAKSSNGQFYNYWMYGRWMLHAFIHSLICFAIPMLSYVTTSNGSNGKSDGLWTAGIVIYTNVVIVTNLKLAMHMKSWTFLHHLTLWGSIVAFFVAMLGLSMSSKFATAGADYNGLMPVILASPKYWLTVLVTVLTALVWDGAMQLYDELGYGGSDAALPAPQQHRDSLMTKAKQRREAKEGLKRKEKEIELQRLQPAGTVASDAPGVQDGGLEVVDDDNGDKSDDDIEADNLEDEKTDAFDVHASASLLRNQATTLEEDELSSLSYTGFNFAQSSNVHALREAHNAQVVKERGEGTTTADVDEKHNEREAEAEADGEEVEVKKDDDDDRSDDDSE